MPWLIVGALSIWFCLAFTAFNLFIGLNDWRFERGTREFSNRAGIG